MVAHICMHACSGQVAWHVGSDTISCTYIHMTYACEHAVVKWQARHVGVNTVRDHDSGKETGNNMYHELQTFKTYN